MSTPSHTGLFKVLNETCKVHNNQCCWASPCPYKNSYLAPDGGTYENLKLSTNLSYLVCIQWNPQVKDTLRIQWNPQVKDTLRIQWNPQVKDTLRIQWNPQVKDTLRIQWNPQVKDTLRIQWNPQVKDTLLGDRSL